MKSIKEKSFELFPEMQTDSDDWDVIEEQCDRDDQRNAYRLGANYVLECIEKMIPSSDDVIENHTKCKSAIFRLQTIIEQLKK